VILGAAVFNGGWVNYAEQPMRVKYTASRDGLVIIALEDEGGKIHEVELGAIDAAQLIGGLRAS
jgi:hypothetical protein